MVLPCLDLIVM
jgi:hypothetical protein